MRFALSLVAVLSLAALLPRAARVPLAGDYVDPVSRITAQDEALYASSSIRMARLGDWLTPHFMGRPALYKPPLLYWLSAASARLFGISRLALRLPVAVICALAGCLVFLWAAEIGGWQAGACAAAMLAGNHLWHVLGGMALTDGLLASFYTAAMFCLFTDPWLERRSTFWGFAAAVAAGILTKSIGGVLPLAALGVYRVAAPRKYRPRMARAALAAGTALALAAPWFLYQLVVHQRWFLTEHLVVEIMGYGGGAPPQTSAENAALFYALRTGLTDPILTCLALVAIPTWARGLRKREPAAVLLFCWIGLFSAAIFGWQYRNAAYLLPMIPALTILATVYTPFEGAAAKFLPALVVLSIAVKVITAPAPWGLAFDGGTVQPVAPLVSDYCRMARGNELMVVGADDDLYASALPLTGLRYLLVGAAAASGGPYAMDFAGMGITVTAAQFNDLARWLPGFRERLREWGVDSTRPVATLIQAAGPDELAAVIRVHPQSDFLIPSHLREAAESAGETHRMVTAPPDHFLLLARTPLPRAAPPAWSCEM